MRCMLHSGWQAPLAPPGFAGHSGTAARAKFPPSGDVPRRRRMGKVFEFLGMTAAVVRAGDSAAQLRAAFSADVVYITAQQLAFTYLGDNALMDESSIVRPWLSRHRRRCSGQPALLPACSFACIAHNETALLQAKFRACRPSGGHGTTRLSMRWTLC